jgi:hypothetical protein
VSVFPKRIPQQRPQSRCRGAMVEQQLHGASRNAAARVPE